MGLGIPPIQIKIMLESNPLKSTMLVGGLAVLADASTDEAMFVLTILALKILRSIRGNHLSNPTYLTQVFFKSGE